MQYILVLDWSIKSPKTPYLVFDKNLTNSLKFYDVLINDANSSTADNSFYMSLLENKSLRNRAQFLNTYFTSMNYFKSKSYKIALKVLVFGQVKIFKSNSKLRLIHSLFSLKKLALYLACVFGFLRIPRLIILGFLKIFTKEVKDFLCDLNNRNIQYIVIKDNGRSNFYFLSYFLPPKIKVIDIIHSWDNTSLKYFPSKNVNFIATWNSQQIREIQNISNIPSTRMNVIGSRLADSTYLKYSLSGENYNSLANKKLLVVGMFNQSLEVMEVLKMKNFINQYNHSAYDKLFYRPHPDNLKSRKLFKKFQLDKLGVEMHTNDEIDFRDFSGIICFPTSMLLEIIISRVPAILFAPKHEQYRTDPFTVYQLDHFKPIRESKPLIVCEDFKDLKHFLISGIPNQNTVDENFISQVFPNYASDYSNRIGKLINQIFI